MSDLLTLKELCSALSITTATGRNWLRLHKLIPTETVCNVPYFSRSYTAQLKMEIASGRNTALKSRRNKKFISGNGIYNSYLSASSPNHNAVLKLLDLLRECHITLTDEQIDLLAAECALRLICQREQITTDLTDSFLCSYLSNELNIGVYRPLVDDLIADIDCALAFAAENNALFCVSYFYEQQEDILGLLYISLKNIGCRKATGSYYTPAKTVRQLISGLTFPTENLTGKTIFDPCCGTGNFLLQLPEPFDCSHIYGNDIDSTSIKITRINLALKFQVKQTALLYQNITKSNYLTADFKRTYDYIIGNPPWGYDFSDAERSYLHANYQCAPGKNIESYDVFTERALSQLTLNGTLSFVLPKAILNVKSHAPIRSVILKENSITRLDLLEDTFDKVQCPSIILQISHTQKPFSGVDITVTDPVRSFTINTKRRITADSFSFFTNDTEYRILCKLMDSHNKTTLQNQADFALGIVTGNNKKYLSNTKTENNEVILKGSDIDQYQIKESRNFITFTPEQFQQTAPESYYRAPEKLLYRFISKHPVFTYDDKQKLSLNSCNILIPHVKDMDIKYILAILNSRITGFIFRKQFDSVKVLRSHIEQIPIPIADTQKQKDIIQLVNTLLTENSERNRQTYYNHLDKIIAELFELTEEEYQTIFCSSL